MSKNHKKSMIKNYALIKDNKVVNIIVADEDFVSSIKKDYDHIVEANQYTDIGCEYDPNTQAVLPKEQIVIGPKDENTTLRIEPYHLCSTSKGYGLYSRGDTVTIGCFKYSAGFLKTRIESLLSSLPEGTQTITINIHTLEQCEHTDGTDTLDITVEDINKFLTKCNESCE